MPRHHEGPGLSMMSPDHAVVLPVDGKTQIQARRDAKVIIGGRPRHPDPGLPDECGGGTRFDTGPAAAEDRRLQRPWRVHHSGGGLHRAPRCP